MQITPPAHSKHYNCDIFFPAPHIPPQLGANIATFAFEGLKPPYIFNPGDTITFAIIPQTTNLSGTPHKAVLVAGYKDEKHKEQSSPFKANENLIDILKNSTATIGSRHGKWGFTVAFSVEFSGTTHFYYLPDPEMQVDPY